MKHLLLMFIAFSISVCVLSQNVKTVPINATVTKEYIDSTTIADSVISLKVNYVVTGTAKVLEWGRPVDVSQLSFIDTRRYEIKFDNTKVKRVFASDALPINLDDVFCVQYNEVDKKLYSGGLNQSHLDQAILEYKSSIIANKLDEDFEKVIQEITNK